METGEFVLDEFAALLVSDQATLGTRSAVRALQLGLRERFGLDLPVIRISEERKHGPRKTIWVVEPRMLRPQSGDPRAHLKEDEPLVPHPPDRTIGVRGLQFTDEMAIEGYFIRVDPIAVVIHGASDAGSYWGAQTLLQLVRPPTPGSLFRRARGPAIPCLWMADWPSNDARVALPELRVPAEPDAAEAFLKLAARYKLNGIAREAVPDDAAARARLQEAARYHPVPCIEKAVGIPGASPLIPLAREAAGQGLAHFALAAWAEAAWGPPDPEPAAFRERFARQAGPNAPMPPLPGK
mgnify:CR=1 FL=1